VENKPFQSSQSYRKFGSNKNKLSLKEIQTREDVELLIDEFYKLATKDELIGYFFTEVVKLEWEKHIPVMYDFWETILLDNIKYKGNPMLKHIEMSKKESMKPEHFERWLSLWEFTVQENFNGRKAEEAISRAKQIGGLMQLKVSQPIK
jgi:hemoglobin